MTDPLVRQQPVLLGADPADVAPVLPCQPERHLRMAEERVARSGQGLTPLHVQRRHEIRVRGVERLRQADETVEKRATGDLYELDRSWSRHPHAPVSAASRMRARGRSRGASPDREATQGKRSASSTE